MGKISKESMKRHSKAMEIIEQDELSYDDKIYVLENYHEGATNMNNLVSAHFTPMEIARSVEQCARSENFVDLCAGIGVLSWCFLRMHQFQSNEMNITGVCIENCAEYYRIGKKLMPEFHWINGDIFDPQIIQQVKDLMKGKTFSIISNPPYGKQVKTDTKELLQYKGPEFEFKAIELGYLLGAYDGAFLIPQGSCNFKMTTESRHNEFNVPCAKYEKFYKETGLEMSPNMGYSTEVHDENGWKDVSIITEIAVFEYEEMRDNTPEIISDEDFDTEEERLYKEKHLVCKAEPGSLQEKENKSQMKHDLMWEKRLLKLKEEVKAEEEAEDNEEGQLSLF